MKPSGRFSISIPPLGDEETYHRTGIKNERVALLREHDGTVLGWLRESDIRAILEELAEQAEAME